MQLPGSSPGDSPRHLHGSNDMMLRRVPSLLFPGSSHRGSMSSPSPPDVSSSDRMRALSDDETDRNRGRDVSEHEAIRIQPFVEEGDEEHEVDEEEPDRGQLKLTHQSSSEGGGAQTDSEAEPHTAASEHTDTESAAGTPGLAPPTMLLPSPIKRKLQLHLDASDSSTTSVRMLHPVANLEQTPAKKPRQSHASPDS